MKCPIDGNKLFRDYHHYLQCPKCYTSFTETELLGFWLIRNFKIKVISHFGEKI